MIAQLAALVGYAIAFTSGAAELVYDVPYHSLEACQAAIGKVDPPLAVFTQLADSARKLDAMAEEAKRQALPDGSVPPAMRLKLLDQWAATVKIKQAALGAMHCVQIPEWFNPQSAAKCGDRWSDQTCDGK